MQRALAEAHAAARVAQSERLSWQRRVTAEAYEHYAISTHVVGRNRRVSVSSRDSGRGSVASKIRNTGVVVPAAPIATSSTHGSNTSNLDALTTLESHGDCEQETGDETLEDVTRRRSRSRDAKQQRRNKSKSASQRHRQFDQAAHQAVVGQAGGSQLYGEISDRGQQQPKRSARRDNSFTALMQESIQDAAYQDQNMDSEHPSDSSFSSSPNANQFQNGNNRRQDQGKANDELAATTAIGGDADSSPSCPHKSSSSPPPPQQQQQQFPGPKGDNARYLREIDRQSILSRLESGEKQAHLAREFKVSRAAICNLNKHRNDVMARRDDGNLLAKHPQKKHKVYAMALHQATSTATTNGSYNQTPVHELKTRSALLLLTKLHDRKSSDEEFKRTTDRLVRLLVEEALALVPMKQVEVKLQDRTTLNGFRIESPMCAVTLEHVATPLLDAFHVLEPAFTSGFLRLIATTMDPNGADDSSPEDPGVGLYFLDAHLPASLAAHRVLLLDVVSSSTELICLSIEKVLSHGAMESSITLVALFVTSEVVAFVQLHFPNVHIVTIEVDALFHSVSIANHGALKNENENQKQKLTSSSRSGLFQARYESLLLQ